MKSYRYMANVLRFGAVNNYQITAWSGLKGIARIRLVLGRWLLKLATAILPEPNTEYEDRVDT